MHRCVHVLSRESGHVLRMVLKVNIGREDLLVLIRKVEEYCMGFGLGKKDALC